MTTFSLPPPSQDFIDKGKTISEPWYRVFLRFVADFLTEVVEDTSPQLGGDLDLNGFNITAADESTINLGSTSFPTLNIVGTNTGNGGPLLGIYHDSVSPAANDDQGLVFYNNNSAGTKVQTGTVDFHIRTVTAGSETGDIVINLKRSGTDTNVAWFGSGVTIGPTNRSPGSGNLSLSTGQAFSALPSSPTKGMIAVVTDSNTATWGATIAGSGANSVLAWYNGTNWTVIGA